MFFLILSSVLLVDFSFCEVVGRCSVFTHENSSFSLLGATMNFVENTSVGFLLMKGMWAVDIMIRILNFQILSYGMICRSC